MSQEYPEEELGKGSIELKSQNLTIDYREHPTRNCQLLIKADQLASLDCRDLQSLADQLQEQEERLDKGRAWYARMAGMDHTVQKSIDEK